MAATRVAARRPLPVSVPLIGLAPPLTTPHLPWPCAYPPLVNGPGRRNKARPGRGVPLERAASPTITGPRARPVHPPWPASLALATSFARVEPLEGVALPALTVRAGGPCLVGPGGRDMPSIDGGPITPPLTVGPAPHPPSHVVTARLGVPRPRGVMGEALTGPLLRSRASGGLANRSSRAIAIVDKDRALGSAAELSASASRRRGINRRRFGGGLQPRGRGRWPGGDPAHKWGLRSGR